MNPFPVSIYHPIIFTLGDVNDFGLLPPALTSPPSGYYVMAVHISSRCIADYISIKEYSQV